MGYLREMQRHDQSGLVLMICKCKNVRTLISDEHPDGIIYIRCQLHKEDEEE